ncbi:CDP-diacylglycerol--glycerol-3-phosphate 3-phosphatidyltransferase [Pelotomaculum terephthalicicum JT]|uniref:CDP-diacylglycerol--glycerol-3-phosphate 3-phosphatidyltransferase n=1 Tax=Pelotomaculum TaxID=191373 RepID=UPI0009C95F03|nr:MULTISPECIES: CDP-diacylglycerol--glycerol-3-phosphate 3-phosphatidyltransferase [Pelotomaculum]MCG9968175.1 CDP-diacylglycerol--glycerol-3-phosphate 3-phosphatidyltransferase [Pelotomaculum terephthalicicum JT]OPX83929.1 MAG: CDP-diacylglycerol--glycerol-3-phosphate 3-phosphatidyltransferase [Pelotomaculum sp. PtaB.Bin117]
MNLPNRLTMARILLIPLFLLIASLKFRYADYLAIFVFVLGAVTDGLDGYFARRNNQVTLLGKFMDPLADKILVSAALIILVEMGRLSGWIAVVIISREFAVTGLRAVAAAEGDILSASSLGKIKTVTQVVAIVAMFVQEHLYSLFHFPVAGLAMAFAVLFTVWSGFDYFINTWRMLKKDGY